MNTQVQQHLLERLQKHVSDNWKPYIEDIRIEFKGEKALVETVISDGWMPDLSKIQFSGTPQLDRFELIVILTYTGDMESWNYVTSPVDHVTSKEAVISGTGKPEECFDRAANLRVA